MTNSPSRTRMHLPLFETRRKGEEQTPRISWVRAAGMLADHCDDNLLLCGPPNVVCQKPPSLSKFRSPMLMRPLRRMPPLPSPAIANTNQQTERIQKWLPNLHNHHASHIHHMCKFILSNVKDVVVFPKLSVDSSTSQPLHDTIATHVSKAKEKKFWRRSLWFFYIFLPTSKNASKKHTLQVSKQSRQARASPTRQQTLITTI